jgi:hypothetical protein
VIVRGTVDSRNASTCAQVVRVVIAAVALWAIPSTAGAHGGNDDPNVIHACIGNISKIARVVGVSGRCITGPHVVAESPAHWAIQGKDGANGVDGTSVTFVDYFSGSAGGCSNGGARYATGNPPVIAYICNGTNGIDGGGGGLASYDELAGLPCTTGANAAATVHLVGLLKRPICAAAISASGRFVDLGTAVFDTHTNLLWEKKGTASDLHDVSKRYTWCVATGLSTSPAIGTDLCAGTGPSWISQVNAEAFGGFSDWRVPTREELLTIRNTSCQPNVLCADGIFGPALYVGFTSDMFGVVLGGPYWASNIEFGQFGFVVDFFGGSVLPMSLLPEFQTLQFPVRAVRTGW